MLTASRPYRASTPQQRRPSSSTSARMPTRQKPTARGCHWRRKFVSSCTSRHVGTSYRSHDRRLIDEAPDPSSGDPLRSPGCRWAGSAGLPAARSQPNVRSRKLVSKFDTLYHYLIHTTLADGRGRSSGTAYKYKRNCLYGLKCGRPNN
jgi:hypothetical protein